MIIWEGPSALTAEPIRVVATNGSDNRKTGDMAQVWFLPQGLKPTDAIKADGARSVCGDCPLTRFCYVNAGQAPNSVARAADRGSYHERSWTHTHVRLGAWGDPASVPRPVIEETLSRLQAVRHTGYTHQWRRETTGLQDLVMASVESAAQREHARDLGYRTFRVGTPSDSPLTGEIECPAASGVQCVDCTLCDGRTSLTDVRKDIFIPAHGSRAGAFIKYLKLQGVTSHD